MTVEELIKELERYPKDAVVFREGDEYDGDTKRVTHLTFYRDAGIGIEPNSLIISGK